MRNFILNRSTGFQIWQLCPNRVLNFGTFNKCFTLSTSLRNVTVPKQCSLVQQEQRVVLLNQNLASFHHIRNCSSSKSSKPYKSLFGDRDRARNYIYCAVCTIIVIAVYVLDYSIERHHDFVILDPVDTNSKP